MMLLPGFTAQIPLERASGHYLAREAALRASTTGQGVTPAYPCACSDPNCQNPIPTCTCDCPPGPDPCAYCLKLPTPCARSRCECICNGGFSFDPCGRFCM
jgi:hypothetical protein